MTPQFRTSSMCTIDKSVKHCVQVATNVKGTVLVRNSTTGDTVEFTSDEWDAFLDGAKKGEFDVQR